MSSIHRYEATCSWSGSTGVGYDRYDRTHLARAGSRAPSLSLSGDAAFLGDPSHLNPEQLIVLAASSCQLLSFLAVAARARIDVVAYEDEAVGFMPEDDPPVRLTRIELRPTITVTGDPTDAKLQRLVELAHRECYVANSLRTEISVHATILRSGDQK